MGIFEKILDFMKVNNKRKGDSMGIEIEDLLKKVYLPKRYYNDSFDILNKFKEEAAHFLNLIKHIDGSEFEGDRQSKIKKIMKEILPDVEKNINSVTNIFNYYENANLKAAQEELDAMLNRMKEDIFVVSIDDWLLLSLDKRHVHTRIRTAAGSQFFRVRAVEEMTDSIQNNPDELFHIPISKKAFTNNERFSLAGFPSLYLSSMLPLAWQECGYPKKYYYSEFQYEKICTNEKREFNKELKFLALYSPDDIYEWGIATKYNYFELWIHVISRYLKQYPLILACSFVNHSGKVSYKQEYVVPQMLMQWVQRNSLIVQGISYFTCVDIKMFPGKWCAYNIAIPVQAPFDEKKYSENLREDFCWSKPKFFSIPLIDKNVNEHDREILYNFIEKIGDAFKTFYFPKIFRQYLNDIEKICVCLYQMMLEGQDADMKFIIHTMDLINLNYSRISELKVDDIIEEVKNSELSDFTKYDFEKSSIKFKEIVDEFVKADRKYSDGISIIIDKYRNTIWNDFHCGSVIEILYTDKDNIDKEISWLHNNHLIHRGRLLEADDGTVSYLKKICEKNNVELDTLWNVDVGDDLWIKNHIQDILTPIFIRVNDRSVYYPDGPDTYDYINIGFDEEKLALDLL